MDYLTPVENRKSSFKEFMQEWVLEQFDRTLAEVGLARPWYWDQFVESIDVFHHMVYASAYTYRATVWFDFTLPGPAERAWLREKYPATWDAIDPVWEQLTARWRKSGPRVEWYTHGATPVGFCDLCQLVLSGGTPERNTARVHTVAGEKYVFCSEPCLVLFEKESERYVGHKSIVRRILEGEAPANLLELLRYFGLTPSTWGEDVHGGDYPWLEQA
jgi:toluene monooxygenase system protein A